MERCKRPVCPKKRAAEKVYGVGYSISPASLALAVVKLDIQWGNQLKVGVNGHFVVVLM